jgi:N-acetylneuraminic acid mutarotase
LYQGWKIYTYNRNISKAEEPTIRTKLRTWFNSGDWCLSENTHRIVIFYGENEQKINVSFQEVEYGSKRDKDVETYHIVFESTFFGYKSSDERVHQELCRKTIQKISWKKQGFWLQDNAQIPIPRTKMLRMK